MFEELKAVEKMNLFAIFSIGATMQDGGKRKRSDECLHSFFFFLNQQFITWCTVADCGSYFVTTYNRSRLHEEMENKREMENRKRTKGTN